MDLMPALLLEHHDALTNDGGTTPSEKLLLYSLCTLLRPAKVIEIGTCAGHSTVWLALAVQQCGGHLISVDNYSRTHGGITDNPEVARQRLKDSGLLDVVTFITSDSIPFMKQQPDNSADIVWVDGSHDYKGALGDIIEALRVASKLIIVHDVCHPGCPTVRRACTEVGDGVFLDIGHGLWVCNGK